MKATETSLTNNARAINARNRDLSILIDSMSVEDSMYVPLLMHDWNAVYTILSANYHKYSDVSRFMERYF